MTPLHGVGRRFEPYRNHHLQREKMQQQEFWPFPTNPELEPEAYGFKDLKDTIAENHIRVVHLFDKYCPLGGRTVAYKPVKHDKTGYPTGKFAYVAVAYCNPNDRYNRKLGEAMAVEMLLDGQSILMPIYMHNRPVVAIKEIFEQILGEHFA